jgi:hypothetical protein
MSIAMMFMGLVIILPINYSGGTSANVSDMGRFTISNLHEDDPKMIAHSCVPPRARPLLLICAAVACPFTCTN